MAGANFKLNIQGLEELKNSFEAGELSKKFVSAIGSTMLAINSELGFAVKQSYNIGSRSLDDVRVNKTSIIYQTGQNVITGSLEYKFKAIDLSKFPYTYVPGSSGRFAFVFSTSILRGVTKVVRGKTGRGGFVPRCKSGKVYRSSHGAQMFERAGQPRLPLRVLYGPTLSQMASKTYDIEIASNSSKLNSLITSFENQLADTIVK